MSNGDVDWLVNEMGVWGTQWLNSLEMSTWNLLNDQERCVFTKSLVYFPHRVLSVGVIPLHAAIAIITLITDVFLRFLLSKQLIKEVPKTLEQFIVISFTFSVTRLYEKCQLPFELYAIGCC